MPLDLAYGRRIYGWWGRHALTYRALAWLVLLGRERSLRRRATEAIGLERGAAVLDLGCGPGTNFSYLEEAVGPGGRVIGLDYSEEMIRAGERRARSAGWTNVELIQGDAARKELTPSSLDGALCTLALSAMPDHESAIRNVCLALKPGARLVILDAKELEGVWRLFNSLVRPLFIYTTNWDPDKDVIAALRAVFGSVDVERCNAGSIYVAVCSKRGS